MLNFRREKNPRKFVELKELLGMGSFGSVYRGIIIDPTLDPKGLNKEAAVKIISYSPEELHQLGRELYFLKNLNSPYIVHYVDSILTGTELWIVMELCDAGSLLDLYHATQKTLDEPALKAVVACR
jgi:serine/threonine protein kinase